MFISFVMSALLSALPNACDPAPQAEEMSNGLVCQAMVEHNENLLADSLSWFDENEQRDQAALSLVRDRLAGRGVQ